MVPGRSEFTKSHDFAGQWPLTVTWPANSGWPVSRSTELWKFTLYHSSQQIKRQSTVNYMVLKTKGIRWQQCWTITVHMYNYTRYYCVIYHLSHHHGCLCRHSENSDSHTGHACTVGIKPDQMKINRTEINTKGKVSNSVADIRSGNLTYLPDWLSPCPAGHSGPTVSEPL